MTPKLCQQLLSIISKAISTFTCNNVQFPYTQFFGCFSQHKERIGSYTYPLAVTQPSWSRFLPVRHFCRSVRSVVHSSGKNFGLRSFSFSAVPLSLLWQPRYSSFFFHALSGKAFFRSPSSTSSNFSVCSSLSFPGSSRNIFFCKYHHLPSQKPSSVLYFAGISKVPCTF